LNEQAKAAEYSAEDILSGIHLLNRLLPPIMESSYEFAYSFFWSKPNLRGEVLCSILTTLFFKENFTVGKSKEGNVD